MLLAATAWSGSHAATFVGDRSDFRDETIYFAMTTRFYDGDPSNNVCGWDHQSVQIAQKDPDWRGDFKGLIDKLDYIKALGFTAIWITPIVQNASGTDFHGYHAMDFSKVDLRYESRKEWGASEDVTFQSLIDAAHAKGMKIILDIVLNHTGNFGESKLNPLFTRSEDIRNQADVTASMNPNYDRLPANYNDLDGEGQYAARFKYFKNPQFDTHNYYHHYGTGWNWDLPNRWWGQIAGDCVDLNTENAAVSDYLVECYGKFIEMGVDGFRIDTTGHISRLTFNKVFIPQFIALGEKYKNKRLNGCPFYMFGECCARFGEVIYRNQHNLSSHFYTWKSPQNLMDQWNTDASWWDSQVLPEGHDTPVGNMALCEQETDFNENSDNVFMKNGAWHEPDYSQASGYNVIDFPMHYNFNNAASAVNIAKQGDHYYNDASFNVVYVDSHDYCPGPNDLTRFNGGTAQWAENMALMFTFRGIPCIYYGSEVEFQKGAKVDAGGTDMPVSQSGRAYFGHYIEGSVNASDFGEYTATGNVAKTLNADLAQHVIRLNKIRAAVPALRKGQYTFDGCSAKGGFAFKRAYKDSYALVALNGGATFTNVPNGTYTDIVTGKTYTGTSITVDAPSTQGQVRVLVKDWKGGIVGEDGKFIYATSAKPHGGSVSFTDPGATQFYTAEDVVKDPSVNFSQNGGSFKTETLTVTATLSSEAASGWYKVGNQAQVNIAKGQEKSFTIGQGMAFGDKVTVTWGAKNAAGKEFTGQATYTKVDPNAVITIYVTAPSAPNLYAWGTNDAGAEVAPCGTWPGKKLSETTEIDGKTFYYTTIDDLSSVNLIFNNNGQQTADITGITEDTYFEYDGGSNATKLDINVTPTASVRFSPNGGNFTGTQSVTVTAYNATSSWYEIGSNGKKYFTGNTSFTIGADMADGQSVTVSWGATAADGSTKTGSVVFTKTPEQVFGNNVVYFDNTANWGNCYIYSWTDGNEHFGAWPGKQLTETTILNGKTVYVIEVPDATAATQVIFNSGNGGAQTADLKFMAGYIYNCNGDIISGVADLYNDDEAPIEYYTLQGVRVSDPTPGIYVVRRGTKTYKAVIR